jgi:hypothetical protein
LEWIAGTLLYGIGPIASVFPHPRSMFHTSNGKFRTKMEHCPFLGLHSLSFCCLFWQFCNLFGRIAIGFKPKSIFRPFILIHFPILVANCELASCQMRKYRNILQLSFKMIFGTANVLFSLLFLYLLNKSGKAKNLVSFSQSMPF